MTVKNQELYNVIEKLPEELSKKVLEYIENIKLSYATVNAPKELIETKPIRVTVSDMRKRPEIKAYAFENMGNIKPIYEFRHITK